MIFNDKVLNIRIGDAIMFTVNELMNFLSMASKSGLLKYNTARTRRTAIKRIFSIEENWQEIIIDNQDLDRYLDKFAKAMKSDLSQDSFKTYFSRVKHSISDYLGWLELGDQYFLAEKNTLLEHKVRAFDLKIPIAIRENIIVTIEGIPNNLTKHEAELISKVILAYAVET